MKLRNAISGWALLIPSLVLNIGLLAAAIYFLGTLEVLYQQANTHGRLVHVTKRQHVENTPRLAVSTSEAGVGGSAQPGAPLGQ